MADFDKALAYAFQNEGGFSNDAHDSGGATKFGITIGDLTRWRKRSVSVQDVRDLSEAEAKEIYKAWYWDTLDLDNCVSNPIAICLFDIGVVRGIAVSARYAQQICNEFGSELVVDGHIGAKSIAAINLMNPRQFITDFSAVAEQGFRAIVANNPSQHVFLQGWINRARRLLTLIPKA